MVASTPSTIILKNMEHVARVEHNAAGAITPGMLIKLGSAGTVAAHATAGGSAPEKMFALEDDLNGRGITDAYDSSTYKHVVAGICSPGVEVYALVAVDESIAIGDLLESNGDGYLREHVAQSPGAGATSPLVGIKTGQVVAIALEAKDSSSPVGAGRLKVRVV